MKCITAGLVVSAIFMSAHGRSMDMSSCLSEKVLSDTLIERIKKDYIDFHQKLSHPQEKTTPEVLSQEADQVVEMASLQQCMLDKRHTPGEYRRGFHNKETGCVAGKFTVLDNKDGVGFFAQPGEYPLSVRFSNGSGENNPDSNRDIRGMALKVHGANQASLFQQKEQDLDFLLINLRNFPVKNFREFIDMTKIGQDGLLSFFEKARIIARLAWSGLLSKIAIGLDDLTAISYHSGAPYLYGDHTAVKYRVHHVLCPEQKEFKTKRIDSRDFLSKQLEEYLYHEDICFEFAIEKRSLDADQDIDDDSTRWTSSEFTPVGFIRLNHIMDSQECEEAQFNPWHITKEHKPLGSISRARSHVYSLLSEHRLHKNYE